MTEWEKVIYKCNSCGCTKIVDRKYRIGKGTMLNETCEELTGWIVIDDKHLCGECALAYQQIQEEYQKKTRELLNIETIELEL